jgi:ribonuclease PH
MLPRSTQNRLNREAVIKTTGRTYEIQRLIGRAMRAVVDTAALGERTVYVDCDVIQADGGTRTAAINGAFIAVVDAIRKMKDQKRIRRIPVEDYLGAISVGIVDQKTLLDLSYIEDSQADVDMTLVMTGSGRLVEIQGGGEGTTFTQEDLNGLIKEGAKGIKKIIKWQKEVLGDLKK